MGIFWKLNKRITETFIQIRKISTVYISFPMDMGCSEKITVRQESGKCIVAAC